MSEPQCNDEVDTLKEYSDAQLWAVVDQRLTSSEDTRLRELIALGKAGQLRPDEKAELQRLLDLVDHQMLLRSEALLLLKRRGHDVEAKLRLGT
jgi:hypothetical protein